MAACFAQTRARAFGCKCAAAQAPQLRRVLRAAPPTASPGPQVRFTSSCSWREAERLFSKLERSPYDVLGVSETSTEKEVKSQYYKLCRVLHPDTLSANKAAPKALSIDEGRWEELDMDGRQEALRKQFIQVISAYEILSNKGLRSKYSVYMRGKVRGFSPGEPRRPHGGHGEWDPWESERPAPAWARPQSKEEEMRDRQIKWGIFGFFGVFFVLTTAQKLLKYEELLQNYDMENFRSMRLIATARERAMEKWREIPPGGIIEYERTRLEAKASAIANGKCEGRAAPNFDEYQRRWPNGSGLGLIAVLDDAQVCGLESKRRIDTDQGLASRRSISQRALLDDKFVRMYMLQSKYELPHPDDPRSNGTDGI